jgi:beta-lactamase class A
MSELTALLEAEAARFTLQEPPDPTAPAGVVEIETLRDGKPLGVGIYVKHLSTGEEAAVRADVVFETQSVIKVALAIRCYQLADAGQLNLAERVRVTRSDFVGGSGILRYFQEGLEPTIRDLVTAMIIVSDNSATDLLLARIGGVADLNDWLAASGYTHTRFVQSVKDSVRLPQITGLAARALGEVRAVAQERGLPLYFGQMTPREAGRMLESIELATAASDAGCAELLAALREQQLGERRLPALLEHPVGHKTGDAPPWDANDIGIVYAPSGTIAVAVFANDLGGNYQEEEDRIGRIGRVVVDYFDER